MNTGPFPLAFTFPHPNLYNVIKHSCTITRCMFLSVWVNLPLFLASIAQKTFRFILMLYLIQPKRLQAPPKGGYKGNKFNIHEINFLLLPTSAGTCKPTPPPLISFPPITTYSLRSCVSHTCYEQVGTSGPCVTWLFFFNFFLFLISLLSSFHKAT